MAITFPRDMPSLGAAQSFEIDRMDFLSRDGGGRLGAISGGQPLWRMEFRIGIGQVATSEAARAFVTAQEGAKRLFYGWDTARTRPLAYRHTGLPGSWSGDCSGWSQSVDSDGVATLTLSGLPVGLVVSANDYVGFEWTTGGKARRALVRFCEGGTANGSGVFAGVIQPAVPTVVPPSATATMDRACCLMRLDMSKTTIGMQDHFARSEVVIAGVQDLLP